MIRRWRRLDQPGLEVWSAAVGDSGLAVRSTLIDAGAIPFMLDYHWTLDPAWRTRRVRLTARPLASAGPERTLLIERAGAACWRIDGAARPEFDGCDEIDVSATPFCNALAVRRFGEAGGTLRALYVEAEVLSCEPSAQAYERLGAKAWRYTDRSVADGFTARLDLDDDGLVARYEGLFEVVPGPATGM